MHCSNVDRLAERAVEERADEHRSSSSNCCMSSEDSLACLDDWQSEACLSEDGALSCDTAVMTPENSADCLPWLFFAAANGCSSCSQRQILQLQPKRPETTRNHRSDAKQRFEDATSAGRGSMGSMKVRWLAAMVLASLGFTSAEVFFGQLQVAIFHEKEKAVHPGSNATAAHGAGAAHQHAQHYYLKLKSGELRLLKFPSAPTGLPRTGAYIMVRTLPIEKCDKHPSAGPSSSAALCVANMMAHESAPRDVFASGQPRGPVKMKALIMQLQVCGQGPATTPDKLAAALFDGLPNSQPETVQGMFWSCSYGNADLSKAEGSQVVTAVVPIPCSGKTPYYQTYDSSTCPFTEWSDVANDYVQRVLGYDWQDFQYKVYVVPPGDLCSWGGMGWVGCGDDCRAWISGDLWMYPTTWMHELGHNLWLNHAGSYQPGRSGGLEFVSYQDDSGAMGYCCTTRCFNAPHSFQLGWSKPIDVLHLGNFPAGEWRTYTLPPRQGSKATDQNMIRLRGDWADSSAGHNLFVEYRHAAGYDAGLADGIRGRVTLHSTPLGDTQPFTTLEAVVGENQMVRETRLGSGLVLWVGSGSGGGGIQVKLCRPSAAKETDCGDQKDDDCDGLVDEADPDCAQAATTVLGVGSSARSGDGRGKRQLRGQQAAANPTGDVHGRFLMTHVYSAAEEGSGSGASATLA